MTEYITYEEQHRRLRAYLEAKAAIMDWHGVSDAANDLRVLEAEMRCNDHGKNKTPETP